MFGSDPLAAVEGETHGTDADAGEYLAAERRDRRGARSRGSDRGPARGGVILSGRIG